jgi:hypothetical protein
VDQGEAVLEETPNAPVKQSQPTESGAAVTSCLGRPQRQKTIKRTSRVIPAKLERAAS